MPSPIQEGAQPKRRKHRSCATCKKTKARCEFIASKEICHRCDVLNIPCIFDADAYANHLAATAVPHTQDALTASNEATSSDHSVEDRLLVIEEALKQILQATGLPSLQSISESLNEIRKDQGSVEHSFQQYPNGSSSIGLGAASLPARVPPHVFSRRPEEDPLRSYPTPVGQSIITLDQSRELTAIFEMRYNHCVYTPILKSHRLTLERPFAFTVMCALALRLKTTIPNQNEVRLKTQRLLQSHLTAAMGARPYTIDAIHGLLLMSLWSSVLTSDVQYDGNGIVPDGWLLMATAIRMAQELHLDRAAAEAQYLRVKDKEGEPIYELCMEKAKVWYALITYDLAMSLASSRPRLTGPVTSRELRTIMNSFSTSPSDRCLSYHLDALRLAHNLYNIHPPTRAEQISSYILQVDSILDSLDLLASQAYEMSIGYLDNPAACLEYRIFHLYQQYCGTVCLIHACGRIGALVHHSEEQSDSDESMEPYDTKGEICRQTLRWANRICTMAEAVINEAFPNATNDSSFLSTAPDHLFTAIAFCAATLIQCQVTAMQCNGHGLERAEQYDGLVERTGRRLAGMSLPDSELPRRYAKGLETMLQRHQNYKGTAWRRENFHPSANQQIDSIIPTTKPSSHDLSLDSTQSLENFNDMYRRHVFEQTPFNDGSSSLDNAIALLDPAAWLHFASL